MDRIKYCLTKQLSIVRRNGARLGQEGKKKKSKPKPQKRAAAVRVHYAPVAKGISVTSQNSKYASVDSPVRIHRREFVGTLGNGPTTGYSMMGLSASTPGYDVNPSNPLLFPWLCGIAENFEKYRFTSMRIDAIPSAATNVPGRYYMAFDYDYDDPVAINKAALMSNRSACEAPVWETLGLTVQASEMFREMPWKYCNLNTRNNAVEPRTAYGGYFMFAADTPTQYCTFDLWITYTVELILPVLDRGGTFNEYANEITVADNPFPANGAKAGRALKVGLSLPGCPIKCVIPGTPDVPNMTMSDAFGANSTLPAGALDCSLVQTGRLITKLATTIAGSTPASSMLTHSPVVDIAAYDQWGKFIGNASSVASTEGFFGPATPNAVSTVGALMNGQVAIDIADMRTAYPMLKYLIGFLVSTTAAASGTMKSGWTYSY